MHKKKLLIVDDQKGIRMLIREIFEIEGFEIIEASGFADAVKMTLLHKPNIAIVDMSFGKGSTTDGGDLIKALKEVHNEITSILLTAYCEADKIDKAIRNGAVCCINKPFDISEIVDTVNKYCVK